MFVKFLQSSKKSSRITKIVILFYKKLVKSSWTNISRLVLFVEWALFTNDMVK